MSEFSQIVDNKADSQDADGCEGVLGGMMRLNALAVAAGQTLDSHLIIKRYLKDQDIEAFPGRSNAEAMAFRAGVDAYFGFLIDSMAELSRKQKKEETKG